MNNKKQSSIDWLISQLDKYYVLSFDDLKNNEAVQQSKAMHKEEIDGAFTVGKFNGINMTEYESQEYYNETYGGDNEQQETK